METPVTFYERLMLATDHAQRKPADVAAAMGVTDAALRGLKKTKGEARAQNAMLAADYLRISVRWLILGAGEMLEPGPRWPFASMTPGQWQSLPAEARASAETLLMLIAHSEDPSKK